MMKNKKVTIFANCDIAMFMKRVKQNEKRMSDTHDGKKSVLVFWLNSGIFLVTKNNEATCYFFQK